MGIINRFFLLIVALVVIALSLAIAAVCLQIVPEHYWLNELRFVLTRTETLAACAIAFLLGLHFLFLSFSRQAPKTSSRGEVIMVESSMGEIGVALSAVHGLVDKLVREVHGVRDVKTKIRAGREDSEPRLKVSLALIIGRETNVSNIAATVSERVRQQLSATMGYSDIPVDVTIADITNAPSQNRQRVR